MNWIKNYVGNLHIVHNGRYRGDCPLCGRVNTFSVTDTGFERLWYCFHADCHTKGSTGVQLTKENSKVAFKEKMTSTETMMSLKYLIHLYRYHEVNKLKTM